MLISEDSGCSQVFPGPLNEVFAMFRVFCIFKMQNIVA